MCYSRSNQIIYNRGKKINWINKIQKFPASWGYRLVFIFETQFSRTHFVPYLLDSLSFFFSFNLFAFFPTLLSSDFPLSLFRPGFSEFVIAGKADWNNKKKSSKMKEDWNSIKWKVWEEKGNGLYRQGSK